MSGAGAADYPDELKLSHWEKRKLNLPDKSEVAGLLKSLQKSHGAVPWSRFDPGWIKSAKTAAELDEALESRQRDWQGSVGALKKDAKALAAAAQKLGKDKAFQEAAKAIDGAVDKFCAAIDNGLREMTQLADKARSGLSDDGEDDEAGPAWMEPKRLQQQLNLCKKDPERTVQFAFVDKTDKTLGVLVLSPKQTGRSMFAKLQKETGVKTGAYGSAWMDGTQLMLQLDKPLSGLVKKLRDPVKACGFRVSKIVLWNADGTVFEEDAEEANDAGATDDTPPTAPPGVDERTDAPDQAALFNARLKALLPRLQTAPPAVAGEVKLQLSEAGVFARKKDFGQALALLDQAEARLGPVAPAPKVASAPSVVFTQSRLAWDKTRKLVQAELRKLELAVLEQSRDEPDFDAIAANTQALYQVLEVLDERLIDKLDEALNATLEADRRARQDEAREIVDEYMDYIRADEFLQAIDDNDFVDVAIVSSLTACLSTVGKQLRA